MRTVLERTVRVPGVAAPLSVLVLGSAWFERPNRESVFSLLDAFREAGGNALDTARAYGPSEGLLGEWMARRHARDEVVLITKCGHGKDNALPLDVAGTVTAELDESLRALRTDVIDLYMLHRDNPAVPVAAVMERLHEEVIRGRVRALGASNWTYARVDAANAHARAQGLTPFTVVSNNLSLAAPAGTFYKGLVSTGPDGERWHREAGVPLLPWSAQARGFFTGRFGPELRSAARSLPDLFTQRMIEVYCTDGNFERLRRARELGERRGGYSASQVALAWVLHRPFPVAAIVGPRSVEEVRACVAATDLGLSDAECSWLNLERDGCPA